MGVGLGSMRRSECLATKDTGCKVIRRIHSTATDEQPGGTGIEFLTGWRVIREGGRGGGVEIFVSFHMKSKLQKYIMPVR